MCRVKGKEYYGINYYKNKSPLTKTMNSKYCKILRICINVSKNYVGKIYILISRNKSRASWKLVKNETNLSHKTSKNLNTITYNNTLISNPIKIVDHLNRITIFTIPA